MQYWVLGLLMLVTTSLLADYPVEIIELKGRSVQEMLPVIRPFISSDGAVTGMNNQLILRTSPESLRDIRAILDRVDTPPRLLLISVRHGEHQKEQTGGVSADIDRMVGKRTKVVVGQAGANNTVRLQGLGADTRNRRELVSTIQAIEGRPAFIAAGESIPITTYRSYGDGKYRHFQSATQYRDATAGFYALPRVNGQRVTVEISPHLDRPGMSPGSFDVVQAATSVSGLLGEWISVGGTTHSEGNQRHGISFSAGNSENRAHNIWLKVEEIR